MYNEKHKPSIEFYKHTRLGHVLRSLTLDDITFWGGDRLISVIFALFVANSIPGGSATHVGLSLTLREFLKAILSIPVGKFFDKHKGKIDEIYGLAVSGLIAGLTYVLFAFATKIWHVYAVMAVVGIAHAVNLSAWRVLFYGSIKEEERGQTVGVYQALYSIVGALLAGISGLLADTYGYESILIIGGILAILGGIIPFFIKKDFENKKLDKE